jgi:hypothetical protein
VGLEFQQMMKTEMGRETRPLTVVALDSRANSVLCARPVTDLRGRPRIPAGSKDSLVIRVNLDKLDRL